MEGELLGGIFTWYWLADLCARKSGRRRPSTRGGKPDLLKQSQAVGDAQ
jgi:hypothetical protein